MEDVLAEVAALAERGERGALAALVWSSGSIPMSDRAKMLVRENGQVVGTIGGGCLEAEVLNAGRQVLESGRSQLMRYTMTEKQAGESGLNCGGTVRIFTELVAPGRQGECYRQILEARRQRRPCLLATLLDEARAHGASGGRLLVFEDGAVEGTLGVPEVDEQVLERVDQVLHRERGQVVDLDLDAAQKSALGFAAGQLVEVFVEPFLPPPVLYIFGGGHVGAEIGRLASHVGFYVVVVDDRPLYASRERHPQADECLVEQMDRAFARLQVDEQSYIVAVTRGHQHDEVVVEEAIKTPARYIGMLGSERKKMLMWKRIQGRGGSRARLDQVSAPIGFNIGADTPAEIAVSVVAELIEVRRGATKVWKTKKNVGAAL